MKHGFDKTIYNLYWEGSALISLQSIYVVFVSKKKENDMNTHTHAPYGFRTLNPSYSSFHVKRHVKNELAGNQTYFLYNSIFFLVLSVQKRPYYTYMWTNIGKLFFLLSQSPLTVSVDIFCNIPSSSQEFER